MIPKIINYCWFGENSLPELAIKCINSWKKYCPDYKIIEWNESNFDLECCDFVKEAYQAKKWAYVSDYARLKIIHNNGGIYLDTDVELIKSLDSLLSEHCFLGEEPSGFVATGLGFGAEKGSSVISALLYEYEGKHFKLDNGDFDMEPCPAKNTRPLYSLGYKYSGSSIWSNNVVTVYPPEFFCPLNYQTKDMKITNSTLSIHWYNASWHSRLDNIIIFLESAQTSTYKYKLGRIISFPFRVFNKFKRNGFLNTVRFILSKLK